MDVIIDNVTILTVRTASVTTMNKNASFTDLSSAPFMLPELPSYTLTPVPPLLPWIQDKYLSLLLPVLAYWGVSMIFHFIDEFDLFPQYRLHTPAEVLNRNRASRWEVLRDVIIQQIVQTAVGIAIALFEETEMLGKEAYDIAVWAQRLRTAQSILPALFAAFGLDSVKLAGRAMSFSPQLAGVLAGGKYPWLNNSTGIESTTTTMPSFSSWELAVASLIYWVIVPMLQFTLAICIVDTWQYFLHRAMHMNKYLYTTFHSRHHRLYVPYAYGALYNHPFEGFLLDTLGAGIGYIVSGMTTRQAMWFFTCSTIKTVDDHCGYALPWDPLQHLTSNNAGYHDVHHQNWGIKTNFSQPFFTFWDHFMGTAWTGGDVSVRYERMRLAAEKAKESNKLPKEQYSQSVTGSKPIDSLLDDKKPYAADEKAASVIDAAVKEILDPQIPPGKATAQAVASREQIVEDESPAGGPSVLLDEIREEAQEKQSIESTPQIVDTVQDARIKVSTKQADEIFLPLQIESEQVDAEHASNLANGKIENHTADVLIEPVGKQADEPQPESIVELQHETLVVAEDEPQVVSSQEVVHEPEPLEPCVQETQLEMLSKVQPKARQDSESFAEQEQPRIKTQLLVETIPEEISQPIIRPNPSPTSAESKKPEGLSTPKDTRPSEPRRVSASRIPISTQRLNLQRRGSSSSLNSASGRASPASSTSGQSSPSLAATAAMAAAAASLPSPVSRTCSPISFTSSPMRNARRVSTGPGYGGVSVAKRTLSNSSSPSQYRRPSSVLSTASVR